MSQRERERDRGVEITSPTKVYNVMNIDLITKLEKTFYSNPLSPVTSLSIAHLVFSAKYIQKGSVRVQ